MDEDSRTVWCGNLSEKVTEDVLYELFLQGGPVQKVSIPKDRDGKQRTYAFITYKHVNSVPYALDLFDGTVLFNRPLSMKNRNTGEVPQIQPHLQLQDQSNNLNDLLQLGRQMALGGSQMVLDNFVPNLTMQMCNMYTAPGTVTPFNQNNLYPCNENWRSSRLQPYQREHDRDRYGHHRDNRNNKDRHSSHRSNDKSRYNNHRSNRWNHH